MNAMITIHKQEFIFLMGLPYPIKIDRSHVQTCFLLLPKTKHWLSYRVFVNVAEDEWFETPLISVSITRVNDAPRTDHARLPSISGRIKQTASISQLIAGSVHIPS